MSKKPTSQTENSEGNASKLKQFMEYFELSKAEMRKVTWPTAKETRNTSLMVLVFVVFMAAFLGLVDLGLSNIIALILSA
ncbi:MAG: preprotein translocase subunit SecE [Desulfovibrionaceae bacterium]|nr:preprotein translocase subunit SecE [Desulfovibrionaceae bacterium]